MAKKSKVICAKCTPVKAFHHFNATSKGICEICKHARNLCAIPKRYFKTEKLYPKQKAFAEKMVSLGLSVMTDEEIEKAKLETYTRQ